MNLTDFIIIYLACGAPFGVYYFFKNRAGKNSLPFWFKTISSFLFWIFFAVILLRRNKNFKIPFFNFGKSLSDASKQEKKIYSLQKKIEKVLLESDLKISIYEFREICERYVGLCFASQIQTPRNAAPEAEFFRLSSNADFKLGSICLARRNRERLYFHHIEARKDFLHLIGQLSEADLSDSQNDILQRSSVEIAEILKDSEARNSIEKLFGDAMQIQKQRSVQKPEKDLWKPETRKPSTVKPLSLPFQNLKTTMNLREKD